MQTPTQTSQTPQALQAPMQTSQTPKERSLVDILLSLEEIKTTLARLHIPMAKTKQLEQVVRKDIDQLEAVLKSAKNVHRSLKHLLHVQQAIPNYEAVETITPIAHRKEVLLGRQIRCVQIERMSDIPMTPIYYVAEIDQFAVNLNGFIIRGHIGDVKRHGPRMQDCPNGSQCTKLKAGEQCGFWHDVDTLVDSPQCVKKWYTILRRYYNPVYIMKGRAEILREVASMEESRSIHEHMLRWDRDVLMHMILRWVVLNETSVARKKTPTGG